MTGSRVSQQPAPATCLLTGYSSQHQRNKDMTAASSSSLIDIPGLLPTSMRQGFWTALNRQLPHVFIFSDFFLWQKRTVNVRKPRCETTPAIDQVHLWPELNMNCLWNKRNYTDKYNWTHGVLPGSMFALCLFRFLHYQRLLHQEAQQVFFVKSVLPPRHIVWVCAQCPPAPPRYPLSVCRELDLGRSGPCHERFWRQVCLRTTDMLLALLYSRKGVPLPIGHLYLLLGFCYKEFYRFRL